MSAEGAKQLFWIEDVIHVPTSLQMIQGVKTATYNNGPYINTGIQLASANAKIEGYALLKDLSQAYGGGHNCILGAEQFDNSEESIKVRRGDQTINCNFAEGIPIDLGKWFYFCMNGTTKTLVVDNATSPISQTSQTVGLPIFIGGQNRGGSLWSERCWVGAIGLVKFFELGKLIGQFIPCKRILDGICGFYDTVTKQFMTSLTSTQFTEWQSA